jgi:hypothetical protein
MRPTGARGAALDRVPVAYGADEHATGLQDAACLPKSEVGIRVWCKPPKAYTASKH